MDGDAGRQRLKKGFYGGNGQTYDPQLYDGDQSPLRRLVDQYPGWPHAVLAYVIELSSSSSEAKKLAIEHLPLCPAGSDPVGREVLEQFAAGKLEGYRQPGFYERWARSGDPIVDSLLVSYHWGDDLSAASVLLGERYPNLDANGRVARVVNGRPAWHWSAPALQTAWFSAARAQSKADPAAMRNGIEWFRRLHGDLPLYRANIAMAYLLDFDVDQVGRMASSLVALPPRLRSRGLYVIAQGEVFRGQLRVASEQHLRALEAEGIEPDTLIYWIQGTRELMRIHQLLGDRPGAAIQRTKLIESWSRYGWPTVVQVAYEWESERDRTDRCPAVAVPAGRLRPGSEQREALRLLHRAAQAAGCGGCPAVLADGPSVDETLLPWTLVYAKCAVEQGRDLDPALAQLRSAERFRSVLVTMMPDPAAVDVVLAHYWMGRILEKKGRLTEARAKYDRFLRFWGEADIPIPEVEDARTRMAAGP